MATEKNEKNAVFLYAAALLIFLLMVMAVYHAVRPGVGRLTADFFYPYLRVSRLAVNAISDRTLLSFSRAELAAKLEQQQKINTSLALQAAAAAELFRENQVLRRYLGIKAPKKWSYITAEVMLRDPLLWLEHFTIDRGRMDGVEQGDAVLDISEDGLPILIGVVGSCGRHNSEVMTVYNPDFCFSAGIGPERMTGFINAGGRQGSDGRIPVGYLASAGTPAAGSAVFTTGFEQRIPGGIKIGELDRLEEVNPLFYSAGRSSGLIRPAFNPNRLRFVIIARRERPTEQP
ncbi:MAG: rod shape-determining protein MreC [Lentisphaeria bacterium]|nr:rod shape-determining protein MreC [Lentisphaeria bacterium]